jgi:hypothetical protein
MPAMDAAGRSAKSSRDLLFRYCGVESVLEGDMDQSTAVATSRQRFRFTVLPLAALATLAVVMFGGALIAPDHSGQLGGDFPAFYAAGSIVADAGYQDLYELEVQRAAQRGLLENEDGVLFFAYPPFVATGYSWLAPLGYRGAYVLQMALMAAAAVASVLLLRPMSSIVRRFPVAVIAVAVLFQPLLASLIGGQNTALTMLLVAGAARAEFSGHPATAGIAIGLLAYKPQYGLPLALVVALSGRWRVAVGTVAAWAALYMAGVAALGWGWVGPWWDQATAFRDTNASANGDLFISLPGFIEHLTGVGSDAGRLLGVAIGGAGLAAVIWLWRRPFVSAATRYAIAGLSLVLIAPQSLFYEAGIGVVTLLLVADLDGRVLRVALGAWIAGWLYVASSPVLNTTLLVLTLLVIMALVVTVGRRQQRTTSV